jgi:HSF-type DNA-binding
MTFVLVLFLSLNGIFVLLFCTVRLNFYGFRKMQSKPIRNSDFDANTAKHVTFFNENFKRGRCDLLKKIQRSTRGGGTGSGNDQVKELQDLRDKVASLEMTISDMQTQHEERMRRLELDMLGRMEQMMMAIQAQQQNQQHLQLQSQSSTAGAAPVPSNSNLMKPPASSGMNNDIVNTFDPLPFGVGRGQSIGSLGGLASLMGGHQASLGLKSNFSGSTGGPTLPPHPKMKQLPTQQLPGSLSLPPGRLDSLRGISTLSRGISNLSRGLSTESQGSAMLGNAFEDKFFSMLMNGSDANRAALNSFMNPTPIQDQLNAANLARNNSLMNGGTSAAAATGNGM